ncbi:MAG: hypothetical protein JO244_15380 [Solirubrobacterales bacterium]|nr:hypothetical protein [Solirubrobacterales bacterium]
MFVAGEEYLDVGFGAAQARLTNLLHSGLLAASSEDCYDQGVTDLARVAPPGPAPGESKLVRVQFGEMAIRDDSANLPLRWHATGPGSGVFPALDADLGLTAMGEDATMLSLDGAYRAPPEVAGAALDRAVLQQTATATIQAFLRRVAGAIVHPASAPAREQEGQWLSPQHPPEPELP